MLLIVELEHLRWWVSAAVDEVGKSLGWGVVGDLGVKSAVGDLGHEVGHDERGREGWSAPQQVLGGGSPAASTKYRRYQKHECG